MAEVSRVGQPVAGPAVPAGVAAAASVAGVGLSNAAFIGVAFAREVLVAKHFGTTVLGDAFAIATTLPELFQNFLTAGLIANAFIPVLAREARGGREREALNAVAIAMQWILLVMVALLAAGLLTMRWAIRPFAPGADAATLQEAGRTALLLWPAMPLLLAGGFAAAVMQYRRRFLVPALAPVIYTLPVVVALAIVGARWGALGAATGALVGAAAQLGAQWRGLGEIAAARRLGASLVERLAANQLLYLLLPIALTQIVAHAGRCIGRAIATTQGVGGIAALTYAFRLTQAQVWLVVVPVSVVFLPAIAAHVSASASAKARELLPRALSVILFVTVPVAVLTYVLRFDLTRLLFERGAFGPQATLLTGRTAGVYALCIIPQGIAVLLARAAYARSDITGPLKATAAGVLVEGISAWALSRVMGLPGIALASFLGASLQAGLLMVAESTRGVAGGRGMWSHILLPCVAGLPMAGAALGAEWLVRSHAPASASVVTASASLVGVALAATCVYLVASAVLHVPGYYEARRVAPDMLRAFIRGTSALNGSTPDPRPEGGGG